MAQGSSFWQWYARVNDDVRHQLIDRGWFGQHQRDNAFERDVDAMSSPAGEMTTEQEASVYTHNPHVPEALEGIGARGRDDANAENVKNVMHEFYGRPASHTAESQDQLRDEAMERFYGRNPSSAAGQEQER